MAKVRHLPVHLLGRDDLGLRVPVLAGLLLETGEGIQFLLVPGDEQCPGPLDRDASLLGVVGQQVVSGVHES